MKEKLFPREKDYLEDIPTPVSTVKIKSWQTCLNITTDACKCGLCRYTYRYYSCHLNPLVLCQQSRYLFVCVVCVHQSVIQASAMNLTTLRTHLMQYVSIRKG